MALAAAVNNPFAATGNGSALQEHERRLTEMFRSGRGALIGDTTCASRSLHTLDPGRPAVVRVVSHADAGMVFYGRQARGEIAHLDTFHQVGLVQHRPMAAALRETCEQYAAHRMASRPTSWLPTGSQLADLVDVQTATGGGRLTGQLIFGTGHGLRRAHLNHVHVACWVPDQGLDLIFWLVSGAEQEILRQGLEIRRLDQLEHEFLPGTGNLDLSPYATPSDSILKGPGRGGPRDGRDGLIPDGQNPGPIDPALAHLALELAGEFGTLEDLRQALEQIARTRGDRSPWDGWSGWRSPGKAASALRPKGLVTEEGGRTVLTAQGWRLYTALHTERRELEAQFKRALRKMPRRQQTAVQGQGKQSRGEGQTASRTRKESCLPKPGERIASIAVVPTALAALARAMQGDDGAAARAGFSVKPEDIRVPKPRRRRSLDVCLVLDGSASMAGRRLRAAKYLAQHLLLVSRDKVGVIVFQERGARVVVPFTRDFRLVEQGLASIEPLGLTPLAEGLVTAAEYVRRARRQGCCLLLITDGIPTVPKWGPYPMDDARLAAAEIGRRRLRLICLGLEPNRGFLTELAAVARGSLYVVEELEAESLLDLVHSHPALMARQR
jgi:magnesium chelatase subunit D